MKKPKLIIAIDPDVHKLGVAILTTQTKAIKLLSPTFPELITLLTDTVVDGCINYSTINKAQTTIYVEASWNTTHNHHTHKGQSIASIAATSLNIGRNHETGRKIIETLRYHGLNVIEQPPLKKCWKGRDQKITQQEIQTFIPNFPKRSNQEERDAALIAWVCAGFPIKINPLR